MNRIVPVVPVRFPFLPGMGLQTSAGDAEIARGLQVSAQSEGLGLVMLAGDTGRVGVLSRFSETAHPLFKIPLVQVEGLRRARILSDSPGAGLVEVQELSDPGIDRERYRVLLEDFLPVLHREAIFAYAERGQEISLDQLRQEIPSTERLIESTAGAVQTLIGWVFGFLGIEDLGLCSALLQIDEPERRLSGLKDWVASKPEPQTQGPGAVRELLQSFSRGRLPYAPFAKLRVDSREILEELVQGLAHPEWRAVMACTQALGRASVAREEAARAIGRVLQHPERSVREAAVKSLGELGTAASPVVPALLESFRQEGELAVFKETFRALAGIGTAAEQVVPFLIGFFDLAGQCSAYHQIFPRLGNPNTGEFTNCYHAEAPRADDHPYVDPFPDDFGVVEAACRTAGRYLEGDERLFAPLCRMLLVHSSNIIKAAAEALLRLGARGEEALVARLLDPAGWCHENRSRVEMWRREILDVLVKGSRDAKAGLLTLRQRAEDDRDLREVIREHLVAIEPPAPSEARTGDLAADGVTRLALVPLEVNVAGYPPCAWVDGNRVFFPWHRLLAKAPDDKWMTDQDEFGVGVLDLDRASCVLFGLPLRFPMLQTGANGAKRKFQLRAVVGPACSAGEAGLPEGMVLSLEDPFSARGRWGTHNQVYLFSFRERSFRRIRRSAPGRPSLGDLVAPPDGMESADNSVCFGELILWIDSHGALHLEEDSTPYHLEDSEIDAQTRTRLDEQRQFHEQFLERIPRWHILPSEANLTRIERSGRTIRLSDPGACLVQPPHPGASPAGPVQVRLQEALEVTVKGQPALLLLLAGSTPATSPAPSSWVLLLGMMR